MTAGIRTTPEQLIGVGGQVGAGAATIEQELRALAARVAPLGSDWAGVAQARFQELWAEWQRDAAGLQRALNGISELLTQAGRHYDAAERSIATSFGRM